MSSGGAVPSEQQSADELAALARAQPNPFTGRVMPSGLLQPPSDVPEIHGEQRELLRALVEEVRRSKSLALQVITGEPGDGKTHLLSILRAEAGRSWSRSGAELAMVPVDPLRDPDAPFLHILRNLVRGLREPLSYVEPGSDVAASPLEQILWRILRAAVERSRSPACIEARALFARRSPTADALELRREWHALGPALRDEQPFDADPDVWTVLCRFPQHPNAVMRWLAGASLLDEELRPLGVRAPIEGEEGAFQALSTLLRLTEVPIVLGFDQLEGVARLGERAITGLLQALGDQVFGAGGRAVVLLFCQAETWKGFESKVQAQTRARLSQRPVLHLGALSPELGVRLIAERHASLWRGLGVTPPHPTFPFAPGQVLAEIVREQLTSPRRVLEWFEGRWQAGEPRPPPSPRALALAEFEKLRKAAPEREYEEAADVALAALRTLLKGSRSVAGTTVIAAKEAGRGGLVARLAKEGREVTVYVEASNQRRGGWAKTLGRELRSQLTTVDRALLLRNEGLSLPPQARELFAELGAKAAVVPVDQESHRAFSAIEALVNGAAAKDLDVPLEVALQVVAEEIAPQVATVRAFLDQATSPASRAGAPPAPPGPAAAQRAQAVLAAVRRPPFLVEETRLARSLGLTLEVLAETTDELAQAGKITVQSGKDGSRTILRSPR